MKLSTSISALLFVAQTSAHSWVGCTAHDNKDILEWMKTNATLSRTIDPLMPWFADLCHGWPRAKQNPGDWVDETKYYLWDLLAQPDGDNHACHPNQRTPSYHLSRSDPSLPYHHSPAPMATTSAGSSIKLMFGGNGHSRGDNAGGQGKPGRVGVYWAGAPEEELTYLSELNRSTLLLEKGFSEESFAYPADPNVWTPDQGLVDKGNWMTVKMPGNMQKGRHMMVWVWSFGGQMRFTTCFDVMIK